MGVYKGLSREALEAQYFLWGTRPGYEENDIPRWLEQSRRLVEAAEGSRLDLEYGPRKRNRLDFFAAKGNPNGFALYIHGGYWQRGETPYVAWGNFTMGDIPLGAVAYRYYNVAIERPSLPKLETWYARICERPAYREHVMNFFGTNLDEWQALEHQSGPSS